MNQQDKDRLRADLQAAQLLDLGVSPAIGLSLLEENERLARDAERYRWLRAYTLSTKLTTAKTDQDFDADVDFGMQHKGD